MLLSQLLQLINPQELGQLVAKTRDPARAVKNKMFAKPGEPTDMRPKPVGIYTPPPEVRRA